MIEIQLSKWNSNLETINVNSSFHMYEGGYHVPGLKELQEL